MVVLELYKSKAGGKEQRIPRCHVNAARNFFLQQIRFVFSLIIRRE
jgi:hypothetical protein